MENNILKTRFAYLDNVRSLVIILVITMHSAVTYSGLGDWYYKEGSEENLLLFELVFFAFYQSFLQAWFMGILFFISGLMAAKALAKRGSFNFIKERLFRLGLPLLLYIFIISPFIVFILLKMNPGYGFTENFVLYLTNFWWLDGTGPLWFVETLLIFSIIYAVLKKFFPNGIKINDINLKNIILTIILTALFAFIIRLVFPIDTKFFNLQFCNFAAYIVMFAIGILISENNLLEKTTDEKNIKWIKLSQIIGVPLWLFIIFFGGVYDGFNYYKGGLNWQSFAFALWEALMAIGFSMGLIAFFRKKVNTENKFTGLMRDNTFGIYFFHAPILVSITLALNSLIMLPILKFAVVAIITSVACLVFSFLIRKIKPIGILLK